MRIAAVSTACLWMAGLLALSASSLHAADEPKQGQVTVGASDPLTVDELAALLGVHVWKLDIALPEGAKHVSIRLQQQSKGKEPTGFGAGMSLAITEDTNPQLLIAIVPLGGSLSEAEKVRVTMNGFGMIAGGTEDNPLRKLGIGRPTGLPEAGDDGTFHLLGGYERGAIRSPVSVADRVISLKIEVR